MTECFYRHVLLKWNIREFNLSLLDSRKKYFNIVPFFSVFLFCFLISFLAVFFYQHFHFPQRYADLTVSKMEEVFAEEEFFAQRARSVLDTRNDVGYVRLLDQYGVLEKSFGFQDDKGFEKLTLRGPEGKTVLLGLKKSSLGEKLYLDAFLWSLVFAFLMSAVFTLLIRFVTGRAFGFLGEFSRALGSVARGDYSVRLDGQSSIIAAAGVKRLCREFNEMASSLETETPAPDYTEDLQDLDSESSPETQIDLRPEIVLSEEQSSDASPFAAPEDSSDEGFVEVIHISDEQEDAEPEQETLSVVTEVSDAEEKKTDVSILVVKIADFESMIEAVLPSKANSVKADYRKFVSTLVNSFGGTIESILRDEVVASFTGSGPESVSKLSCVCCAVEMMQVFYGLVDGQKVSEPSDIKLKIGISSASLSVSDESDVIALAKPFVDEAKTLCSEARPWSVFVTTDFREGVSDYLEVRREKANGNLCYAVTGVEQEALERSKN